MVGFDLGISGGPALFQETQANDEIIDARVELGTDNGSNFTCYALNGQANMVRLTCDSVGVALADLPTGGSGNIYQVTLVGKTSIGTVGPGSTVIYAPTTGVSQLQSANIKFGEISTISNCAASSASPAACGAAPAGVFTVPAGQTSYTVNTTAVTASSRIHVQQITDNTGIPSSPSCSAVAATPLPSGRDVFHYWLDN